METGRGTLRKTGVSSLVATLLLWLSGPARAQQDPVHVVVPQSRMFAYTTEQQGAVRVTRVEAAIRIVEAAAKTTLVVSLQNTTTRRQEAKLIIPIADDAVVSGFAYDGPAGPVTAQVLPKAQAERIYHQLVAQIRDPALAEFIGYRLIETSVFPIEAQASQKVQLTYDHLLATAGNRVDYCLPRTESLQYEVPWRIQVDIESGQPISTVYSPSHVVYTHRTDDRHVTVITDPEAAFTPGPFQVCYLTEGDGLSGSLLAYPDDANDTGYFLFLAGLPPTRPADANAIPREVTLVLDRSGSMAGEKIKQVQDAAVQVVSGLDDGESFNVIIYNQAIELFAHQPVRKDGGTETAAHQYIRATRAEGSTNLYGALQTALGQPPTPGTLPLILFLTDGLPTFGITSETTIRDLIAQANPFQRRVFTFGVGVDLNAPLLDGLAQSSRARSFFVLPGQDVETTVTSVFQSLAGPVFADITLRVLAGDGTEAPGRTQDILPAAIPDLFEGDRLVLLGRYLGTAPLMFTFQGNYLGQRRTFTYTFGLEGTDKNNGFIPRLWASRKVAELIDSIRQMAADPSLAQNNPRLTELAQTIVRLSTEFGIITEYTAFLAREGTDLSDAATILGQTQSGLYARAATRSGSGAVNQSMNMAMQRSQEVLNRDSSYLNSELERTRIVNAQQANDLTFYFKEGRWIDSRLVALTDIVTPHRTVVFGSDEFFQVAARLTAESRQGALAFAQDILVLVDGEIVLIDIPPDVEEPYEPVDPSTAGSSGSSGAAARRGR